MSDSGKRNGDFTTTNWSVVLEAQRTDVALATAALERLCTKYWHPIYVFIRRRGASHHEAEDLTQSFFSHLLDNQIVKEVDTRKGKFRSLILASLTHFLTNEWSRRQTLKRGGRLKFISLDELAVEQLYRQEIVESFTPEKLFDRRWALTVLDHVLARLRQEYTATGKAELFRKLEPGLTGEVNLARYAEWAAALNMNEGALKVALHRLRRRFGELLRSEVAHTVTDPEEVAGEIRHLLAATAGE